LDRAITGILLITFATTSGKKMFYLKNVELAESSVRFENAFKRSAMRRKLAPDVQAGVLSRVHELREKIKTHPEAYTPSEPTEVDRTLREVAEMFTEARKRGYRTPHKC
jgi:hypothetical protein